MSKLKRPKFATEAEEAKWWYDNRRQLSVEFVEAAKQGKVKRLTLDVLKQQLVDSTACPAVSIRIAESDLERARKQAAERGLPYQPYQKWLFHQALARNDKKKAS